ncbi:MAG: TonB-dependent receptor family protein [Marinicellaceae bacterium]
MKLKLVTLVFLLSYINSFLFAHTKEQADDTTNEKLQTDNIIVTGEVPNPLNQEAKRVESWSGSASFNAAEYWQEQRAANIKDILDFVPGIFAQQRNGAESSRLSVRGSGLGRQFQGGGLLLLQDGIPLNSADGSFDFQAIDPLLIDYVSVFRGGNAIALGGSTLGGAIQLGSTQPNHLETNIIRLSAGSFDTQRAMISSQLGNTEGVFRVRASHFNQEGFREQNKQRSNRIDLQYFTQTKNRFNHRLGIYHLNTQAQLPSSLSKFLIDQNPRQTRGFNIFGNFNRDLTLSRFSYQFSDENLSATFFIAQKKLDNPVFTYINRDSDDIGLNFTWQKFRHQFQFTLQSGKQDESRRENEAGLPGLQRLNRQLDAQTSAASYIYQLPLIENSLNKVLTLDLGIQAVYAQRDINETFPVSIISNRNYSQINPRVAIEYQPQNNNKWFASISRSFEAPTFAELNNGNQPGINAPIKAQSADTLEIGNVGLAETINWDVSIYYSKINNEFIRFRFPDGNTRTTNAQNSIHWGLEALLNWNIADNWLTEADQLSLTNSYQNNQFNLDNDADFVNNKIPGIPEHYFQSRLKYKHPRGWAIIPSVEWIPSGYYIDLANTVKTDNYLLTGLSVIFQHSEKITWFFDAKNLNDQTYISTTLPIPDAGGEDGNYFYSGESRNFTAGLRWSFD